MSRRGTYLGGHTVLNPLNLALQKDHEAPPTANQQNKDHEVLDRIIEIFMKRPFDFDELRRIHFIQKRLQTTKLDTVDALRKIMRRENLPTSRALNILDGLERYDPRQWGCLPKKKKKK